MRKTTILILFAALAGCGSSSRGGTALLQVAGQLQISCDPQSGTLFEGTLDVTPLIDVTAQGELRRLFLAIEAVTGPLSFEVDGEPFDPLADRWEFEDPSAVAVKVTVPDCSFAGPGFTLRTTLTAEDGETVLQTQARRVGVTYQQPSEPPPPTGEILVRQEGGPGEDVPYGTAVFDDGSFAVVGTYQEGAVFGAGEPNETTLAGNGGFVARYATDGRLAWVWSGPGRTPLATAALTGGALLVGGSLLSPADGFVARYDAAGGIAWEIGAGDSVGLLGSGGDAILVAGSFFGPSAVLGEGEPNETTLAGGSGATSFLARYDLDGTLAWARTHPGTHTGIAVFDDGSSILAGYFQDTVVFGEGDPNETTIESDPGKSNLFLARYAADGALVWARRDGVAIPNAIARHPSGGVTVVGSFVGTAVFGEGDAAEGALTSAGPSSDLFVARYGGDGALAWVRQAGGSPDGRDVATSVATFPDGSSAVTGTISIVIGSAFVIFGSGEPNETLLGVGYFVARYESDGDLSWVRPITAVTGNSGGRTLVAAMADGTTLFTTGHSRGATFAPGGDDETSVAGAADRDVVIAGYDALGSLARR